MDENHVIVLTNGTKINATYSGNNYITTQTIKKEDFDDLSGLTIDNKKPVHPVLNNFSVEDGKTYFVIGVMSHEELVAASLEKLAKQNGSDITDIQVALADIYESIAK